MASADLREELDCPICLNIFSEPIMLRCGHNFCRDCIVRVLDTQKPPRVYSCPECREEFSERPALQRNLILRKMVESVLSAQPNQKAEVFCTYCVDSPVPAVKSCLLCDASLCDKHLKVHSKSQEHILIDPTSSLENWKCSIHKELLKYYCTEDSACVCMTCTVAGEHRGHQVETLEKAADNRRKKLVNILQKLVVKKEKTEEKVWSLQEHKRKLQDEASEATERVTVLFKAIKRQLEDLEKRALREITRQRDQTFLPITDLLQKVDIKAKELSKKIDHFEKMCNTPDPLTLLQESDADDTGDTEDSDDELRDRQVHGIGDLDITLISKSLNTVSDVLACINQGIYVKRRVDVVLDENTAGNNICISSDGKTAFESKFQIRPVTKVRFHYPQVMSTTSFSSGRHSWEVEIKKSDDWRIGMCYPSIDRKGQSSGLGYDKKSWCLRRRFAENYTVRHDNNMVTLPHNISSDKIRVCLDYEAGQLSFYELGNPIKHLHTFTTTFREPLHATLCVWGGSLKICG